MAESARDPSAVIVVEGLSDKAAVETLAEGLDVDLAAEGIAVVAIGGAQAIRRFLGQFDRSIRLAGFCDAGEERDFAVALEQAGLGSDLTRPRLEQLGFYVCERDLEDELIRALGTDAVEQIVEAQGDLRPFRTLQKQPEWQGRPTADQLHRFMGSGGSRKIRYARLLVEALEPDRAPRALTGVLAAATAAC